MHRIITFDVWGTLILPERENFQKELCRAIMQVLREHGHEVTLEQMLDIFRSVDKKVRERRLKELTYIPPEEAVKQLLQEVLKKDNVSYSLIDDVHDAICKTIVETDTVKPADRVQELLKKLKDMDYRLAIISNVVFWHSSATRKVLRKFNISKYFDYEIYADIIKEVKPSTKMLKHIEDILNGSIITHVGDSLSEDVAMAIAYKVRAVFIDRRRQILQEGEKYRIQLNGGLIIVSALSCVLDDELFKSAFL